jgi:P27 family predicted phage terminase small subunit
MPGHRSLSKREPKPTEITPAIILGCCPEYLSDDERHWWAYYGEILASIHVLTEADLMALEQLCKTTSQRVTVDAALLKSGPLYKTPRGVIAISPAFKLAEILKEREFRLLREFGMTPSARTRVAAEKKDTPVDDLDKMLMQPRKRTAERLQ